ncbi:Mutator-like transposase-like protein [Arabidopsis thaliana]|uniref:Mutator-like transposase-like protein n=2 Tax=Arabidopsis thaliana TaxID=3702 RepID=Q9LHR2_ARATH|nr:hypothetical protein At3g32070 [Arabidopsis thaliana]BAB01938.1 Mutator-like transposase-like protein [Arabidopsis thaliana]
MDRECERDPYYDDLKVAKRAIEQMEMVAMMEGIPKFCPCGGSIVDTRKDEKRYYQCEKFKDDRTDLMHIRKLWDKAMEEEVSSLRESVDYNRKKVLSHEYLIEEMQKELKAHRAEIVNVSKVVFRNPMAPKK